MTVCIAAACDGGERIVTATDGLLSLEGLTSDAMLAKILWMDQWQIMYAGSPAHTGLITEEMHNLVSKDHGALSVEHVRNTVRKAYRRCFSSASMFEALLPFGITPEEFKASGRSLLGEQLHSEIAFQIRTKASTIADQLLVTGWGDTPSAAMIYEIGPSGDAMHQYHGYAAIGSGAQVAQWHLMLLDQARHRTLSETIFNVAVAKFAAEKSADLDVGRMTAIYVSRKRKPDEEPSCKFVAERVCDADVEILRELWREYIKLKVPDEARLPIQRIAAKFTGGNLPVREMISAVDAVGRLAAKYAESSQGEHPPDHEGGGSGGVAARKTSFPPHTIQQAAEKGD